MESKSFKDKSIEWNPTIETTVKIIGEKSKGYKIIHINQSRNLSKIYEILSYTGILLGPISGLISAVGTTLNPDASTTLPIIATCVGFVSGIIAAANKFGKFEEKSSAHKLAASKYTSLESNVRRHLSLDRKDRVSAARYLDYVGNSFDDLFTASPLVDQTVFKKYVNTAKKKGVAIPDEYEITINTGQGENAIIPRTEILEHFPELNKFADKRMEYELCRLAGFVEQ